MEPIERLQDFIKMWRWLGAHPANDRKYYLRHVLRTHPGWHNDCPLANAAGKACTGCRLFWQSNNGTLCSDTASPFRRWEVVDQDDPDTKMYFASQVGAVGIRALSRMKATAHN